MFFHPRHTPNYRRLIIRLITIGISLSLITTILYFANLHKGYQITTVDSDTYRIDVQLSYAELSQILDRFQRTGQDSYPLRDVCLPNGLIATTNITSQQAQYLAQSNSSTVTVTNYWHLSKHTGASTNYDTNTFTIFLTFSYQDILKALDTAQSEHTSGCHMQDSIMLPNGHEGVAWLSSDDLENFRRRMHCVGATKISLPFHWRLGVSTISIPLDHTF